MQSETKTCQNCKKDFIIEPDDFGFYEQMEVPAPTWCPRCRLLRRLAPFGYRILYKGKCAFTDEDVITFYHPESGYKLYKQEIWHSDKWDPRDYGRNYDFEKSFFEQFADLMKEVPKPALHTEYTTMINSEYCNAASDVKNCYLCFKFDRSEECAYCNTCSDLKNCFDVSYSNHAELCYEGVNLEKCYQTFFSQECGDCHDVWFSKDLIGCSNCVGCINLRSKNYHIFNEPYSKEEYEKIFKEYDFGSVANVSEFEKKAEKFMLKYPRRQFHGRKNTNVSGDYIYNSKNVLNSYWVDEGEDIKYSQLLQAMNTAKAYDYTSFAYNAEWIYESAWVGINTSNVKFSFWNYRAHDIEYCFGCHGAGNMFGCDGVRKGNYCILNKQYSKEEYGQLVEKIKQQMTQVPYVDKLGREYRYGEFFPPEFLPWAYNESHAQEFYPSNKEDVLQKGFIWRDDDSREYKEATSEVPDHIKDVDDNILKEILKCTDCNKNYQIIGKELQFLKRFNLPIPIRCPLCRDRAKISRLNPMEVYDRKCAKCDEDIKTSYAPDRPETVYCEKCYQDEVA
ncbi:MAG: hypothetical protein ABH833_01425 [Parcubacteria group bacterium]